MANRGVNKVILIGNLGADPEVRFMTSGDPVANIRLATNEVWRDRNTNEQQVRTEWHRVVFFRKLAEIVNQYLKKGSQVYIEGSLRTQKWQGQDGQDRYTTEIVANEMHMLDSRSGGTANFDDGPGVAENSSSQPPPTSQSTPQPSNEASSFDDFDDDVPF